jgi:hypothetical protein
MKKRTALLLTLTVLSSCIVIVGSIGDWPVERRVDDPRAAGLHLTPAPRGSDETSNAEKGNSANAGNRGPNDAESPRSRRGVIAIRDHVSSFQKWGTKMFTLPTLELHYD